MSEPTEISGSDNSSIRASCSFAIGNLPGAYRDARDLARIPGVKTGCAAPDIAPAWTEATYLVLFRKTLSPFSRTTMQTYFRRQRNRRALVDACNVRSERTLYRTVATMRTVSPLRRTLFRSRFQGQLEPVRPPSGPQRAICVRSNIDCNTKD